MIVNKKFQALNNMQGDCKIDPEFLNNTTTTQLPEQFCD